MKRLTLALGLLGLAALLAACSTATAAPAATATPGAVASGDPGSGPVTIVAKDLSFVQPEITVPAGTAFDLTFDNQDGAPHNVAIYTDSSASTKVSVGEIFSGPGQKTQPVPALAAGTYFFRCDVHQNMTGTIVAK
jgi:plastocyanin